MDLLSSLKAFWSERAQRERRLLAGAAVLAAAALLYLTLIEPAASGVRRLQVQLPQARARAAQLEALAGEAKNLRKLPPAAAPGGADARTSLDKSLAAAGLKAARSEMLPNGDLHLVFTDVAFAKWTTWLAASERALGVHATAVHVKANGNPGNADIDLSLRLPRAA
jgi:type II secretory pathway component PulM